MKLTGRQSKNVIDDRNKTRAQNRTRINEGTALEMANSFLKKGNSKPVPSTDSGIGNKVRKQIIKGIEKNIKKARDIMKSK